VGALADERVGEFIGAQFVSAYKKVGTFQKNGNNKQGGNVATYFCLPDETVIHAVPGPVAADVFLREARWAVDVYESAVLEHPEDPNGQRDYLKQAHAIRYLTDQGRAIPRAGKGAPTAARIDSQMPKALPRGTDTLEQAHWLLWANPMPRLASVYQTVWTDVLNEKVTDVPVRGR
jgi:hypothetical protein